MKRITATAIIAFFCGWMAHSVVQEPLEIITRAPEVPPVSYASFPAESCAMQVDAGGATVNFTKPIHGIVILRNAIGSSLNFSNVYYSGFGPAVELDASSGNRIWSNSPEE